MIAIKRRSRLDHGAELGLGGAGAGRALYWAGKGSHPMEAGVQNQLAADLHTGYR